MDESIKLLKPGALRATIDGLVQIANPRDPLYSTISMFAEEYWDGEQWIPIRIEDAERT